MLVCTVYAMFALYSYCGQKLLYADFANKIYHNISLRLKEVQMGTHDFKYNNVPLFARKPGNIKTSMSVAPKLALVPASCYYCDVSWSYHNVCAKIH